MYRCLAGQFTLFMTDDVIMFCQVPGPPNAGAFKPRTMPPTSFRKFYERGDFPIALEHDTKGNKIAWKVSIIYSDIKHSMFVWQPAEQDVILRSNANYKDIIYKMYNNRANMPWFEKFYSKFLPIVGLFQGQGVKFCFLTCLWWGPEDRGQILTWMNTVKQGFLWLLGTIPCRKDWVWCVYIYSGPSSSLPTERTGKLSTEQSNKQTHKLFGERF